MRTELNPRSLLNLENICEMLYKLHPKVLKYLSTYKTKNFKELDNEEIFANFNNFIKADNITLCDELSKYIQLDTDEYIKTKFYVEIEDTEIGKKVQEFVRKLEQTGEPEMYFSNKKDIDLYAYFNKGYDDDISISQEQRRKLNKIIVMEDDLEGHKEILIKEKLYI